MGGIVAAPVLGPAAGIWEITKAGAAAGLTIWSGYSAYKAYRKAKELYKEYRKLIERTEAGHLKLWAEAQQTLGPYFKPPEGWKKWGWIFAEIFRLVYKWQQFWGGS